MEENLITVTGNANIQVTPDVTILELSLQSMHDTYAEAYAQATSDTKKLAQIMSEALFDKILPKTTRFDIEKKTENQYDKNRNFIGTKFLGFQLDHRLKIEFDINNVLLNIIVQRIGQNLKQAEISIGYAVKDPRPAQLKALENAVKDAREKAEIMARVCGSRLNGVKKIDYGIKEVYLYSQARVLHDANEACYCKEQSLDITPDDLNLSDRVTVIWYLDNN